MTSGSSTSASVTIWPGSTPITRMRPAPSQATRRSPLVSVATRTVLRTQSGTTAAAMSATGRPALSTMWGRNSRRSGRSSRSAR